MNNKTILFLMILVVVLVSGCAAEMSVVSPEDVNVDAAEPGGEVAEETCSISTYGPCSIDSDCITSGCNGEVCQSTQEGPKLTTCAICDEPDYLDYECKCIQNTCKWYKNA